MAKSAGAKPLLKTLHHLYEDNAPEAYRFRYGLMIFDLTVIAYIIVTSFFPPDRLFEVMDVLFGIVVLADLSARLAIASNRKRELLRFTTWTDVAAVISFLAPLSGAAAGFLRILRTLRMLRTYQVLARLRADSPYFRRHEDVILAVTNMVVFVFVMTAIVYTSQRFINPDIGNFVDALYFTVTTLSTTGFGDIVLEGTPGRLISVAVMVAGVTLFFNLARALLHPSKVRYRCPNCGLLRHDHDAVHCKACGTQLNIPDEGLD